MNSRLGVIVLLSVFLSCAVALAQTTTTSNDSYSWTFDTRIGSEPQLGFNVPSTSIGSSIEYPLSTRVELGAGITIIPWETINAGSGHAVGMTGTGIGWVAPRLGISIGFRHDWLWTPQFSRSEWNPEVGTVFRDKLYRPGRLYVSYLLPTGCSHGDLSCLAPTSRTQGLQGLQEIRLQRFRLGLQGGIYHYCDGGTSADSRKCKFSPAGLVIVRFEFRGGGIDNSY
jgi:hypothetical protein